MNLLSFILRSFRLLREHQPWKLILIFVLTLVTGLGAGFSIVLLIPLLQLLDVGGKEQIDGVASFFREMADYAGIGLTLESVLLVYLVLLTLMPLLNYWKSLIDAKYQQTFIYKIRRRLFRKIILAEWPLLNQKSKNNHLQVLTEEVPNLANYYYFYLHMLMTIIMMVSYVAWAMIISVKITLFIILAGGFLFLLLRSFLFKAFHLGKGFIESYSQLLKYIDEFWQTVKIAKVHNSEDFYYKKFDEATTSLLGLEYQIQKNRALPQLIYRVASVFMLVPVVYIGFSAGNVPLTSFFILILLFSRIFPQLTTLNSSINFIITALPSVKMVMRLDEEFKDTSFSSSKIQAMLPVENEILIEDLVFSYPGGEKLFNDFTERIPSKKITGIVGESGRGKTTLIDLIAGLQQPKSGIIYVDGKKLDNTLLPAWRKSIGYLPQDSFFIEGTLRDNLIWDSRQTITDEKIWKVLSMVNADHLVKRYQKELDEYIVNYQFNYSGGERQRLALARVLLREPYLLLLDEATSSLDSDNEQQIMEVIVQLKQQVTVLFVTHRTSLLPYFDKTIQLNDHVIKTHFSMIN
jgi:ATP-binding cassette, subfamily C, bacterial